ncbi:glutathione S-transferase family protein [Paraburkholderia sp. USG1]|uniref:glutathione S-transferase family protein n=1 Tax=Paraburkholderia sp. USG1 TaxID=2952268 RepID=UPI002859507E|nr:glutathione S-transferase family protein [Paraburkholderia sp. USG1]MDR8401059.1 glutathione S-transferase family protein [Paraburkholderia sp. USG1]
MLKLYDDELCGDSYKVRLMLGLLGVPYRRERIELYPSRQNRTQEFLAMSPLGRLPVLEADGALLHDAHAILVYLARRYGDAASGQAHWLPLDDPLQLARIQNWLGFAAQLSAMVFPLRDAVLHAQSAPRRLPDIGTNESRTLLRVLDETLWFNEAAATPFVCATSRPTIADIACFVPVALLDEAEIESIDYPAFRRWSRRLKRLDGFTTMVGVYAAV